MRRRGGLGRGLEALIPSSPQDDHEPAPQGAGQEPAAQAFEERSGPSFEQLPLSRIDRNPRQPREAFDEGSLQDLTTSIEAVGVLQPIVVRPSGDRYQIVMVSGGSGRPGRRGWSAFQPSFAPLRTTSFCGTHCWRTFTERT